MARLGKLRYDEDNDCYTGRAELGTSKVKVYLDTSEGTVPLDQLKDIAESICEDWHTRLPRFLKLVSQELVESRELKKAPKLQPDDCVPFYLRVDADAEGEISYTVAFKVPSLLRKDEYVDLQEELNGAWVNTDICCTE